MRAHSFPTRLISLSLIVTMLNLVSLPAQAAFQQQAAQKSADTARQAAAAGPALDQLYELTARHALTVQQLKSGRSIHKAEWYANVWQKVTSLFTDDAEDIAAQAGTEGVIAQLLALRLQVEQDQTALMNELAAQAKRLGEQHAAPEILQRQRDLIRTLDSRHHTLQGLLAQLAQAHHSNHHSAQRQALTALQQQLSAWQPVQAKTDLQHLPWGSPEAKVRAPITAETAGAVTPAGYTLNSTQPNTTAQDTTTGAIQQWRATEYRIAQYLLNRQPLRPAAAALSGTTPTGDWPVLKSLPADIQPADTAATDDAQHSPAVQALATQLHHNPAEIYKWVYDSIEYIPSYGSIQGADFTLQTKRGNAFDTASVLIALLRASGIPARYVYGTVDIPAKTAMDWVGGVNNLDAAQNLLSQGGVPNVGLTKNGVPVMLRLEHVWVEANIAMLPSRGGLGADSTTAAGIERQWVPLDASYKRMQRAPSQLDFKKEFPIDAEKLKNTLMGNAVIDSESGNVQGLDPNALQTFLNDYYFTVDGYFSQEDPRLATEKSLNISNIRTFNSKMLSPVLPYTINTIISDYQKLPEQMRARVSIKLYQSQNDKELDNPSLSFSDSLPNLTHKKVSLNFLAADSADEQLIDKYKNDTSIPAYLVRLKARISVGVEEQVRSEASITMGSSMIAAVNVEMPWQSISNYTETQIRAGDERVLGINSAGMPYNALYQEYIRKFGQAKSSSDNLYLLAINFWMLEDFTDFMIAQKRKFIVNRLPSYGWFSSPLHVKERYGIAYSGNYHVRSVDIVKSSFAAIDVDNNIPLDGLLQMGINNSNLEGAIFDYPTKNTNGTGISATRLILEAAQKGQRIFTITKDNYQKAISGLHVSSAVQSSIFDAVNAGKIVIIPEGDLYKEAWTGLGYIIFDMRNGSGAYMLDGGSNGGYENPNCKRQPQTSPVVDEVSPLLSIAVILGIAAIAVATDGAALIALAGTAEAAMAQLAASGAAVIRVVQFGVGAGAVFYAEGAMASVPAGLPPINPQPNLDLGPDAFTCSEAMRDKLELEKKIKCEQRFSCSKNPPGKKFDAGFCVEVASNIEKGIACASARINIMNVCYNGGDDRHHRALNEVIKSIEKCQFAQYKWCTVDGCIAK